MLSIIGKTLIGVLRFSLITSGILLTYLVIRESYFALRTKYFQIKYRNEPEIRENVIWSIYKDKKLKYALSDFEYSACKNLDYRLKQLNGVLKSSLITSEEKRNINKTIKKDMLNLKTITDIRVLDIKIKKILDNYNFINKYLNKDNPKKYLQENNSGKVIEFKKIKN